MLPTVGIIGYCCKTGLGIMTYEYRKHLGIDKHLIIPHDTFPIVNEWGVGQWLSPYWKVDRDSIVSWILEDEIDTVISIETTYGDNTFRWAKEAGARTIIIPMWEWYHPQHPQFRPENIDMHLCPSWKTYTEIPHENKKFVPCPVDTEALQPRNIKGPAKTFVHNAGHGGVAGRKGTNEAVEGFVEAVRRGVDARLLVRSQVPLDKYSCYEKYADHPNIEWRVGTVSDYRELYSEGEALLVVHHLDGQCLVAEEGMAAGMAVITTDAEPMNEFAKDDTLLVEVERTEPAELMNPHCVRNIVSIEDLADKITWCCENDLEEVGAQNRKIIEDGYSWKKLKGRWIEGIVKTESKPIDWTAKY